MVEHAGGAVAAPIFRNVARMALKYKGLTPQGTDHVDVASLSTKADPANATYELLRQAKGEKPPVQEKLAGGPVGSGRVRLPDMTGWPVREAVRQAIELGVTPKVVGTGLLAKQTPGPGGVVDKGASVVLVFEPAT